MNWHKSAPEDTIQYAPKDVFNAGLQLHHIANTAYPIGHIQTMRSYRIPNSKVQETIPMAWKTCQQLGLYVHIPFCEQRCGYCEYCVVEPDEFIKGEDAYFGWLLREFELYQEAIDSDSKTLIGFDIGGGTPSATRIEHIAQVIDAANKYFSLPEEVTISIETTPRIAANQPEKVRAYYQMGIRRISMGVQTINPRLLEAVERPHTSLKYNRAATDAIRKASFEKFNIDVMYGFAGQSEDSVRATLKHAIELSPEYITLYRMRYKGTRISGHAERVSRYQVTQQYHTAKELLIAAGYLATPGKNTFSRVMGDHGTSDYLTERVIHGTPYLGLGLGAQSLSETTLAYNAGAAEKNLTRYGKLVSEGKLPIQDLYHLSQPAAMAKMIAISFYFGEIDRRAFVDKFGCTIAEAFPLEVEFLLKENLMTYQSADSETLRLTERGLDNYNGVIALFYTPAVKAYLFKKAGIVPNQGYSFTVPDLDLTRKEHLLAV